MTFSSSTHYFLGSNSCRGFYSLYDSFCPPEKGCFLNVIKGGPGCGKSSFMKRIGAAAEERGLAVEYVLCSGDPDSLDGVYIPDLKLGYVDGTAPHRIDLPFPGCSGMYLDLGRFYNSGALLSLREEIIDLNRRYKALYSAAYSYIAAATAAMPRCCPEIWSDADRDKVRKKAEGFAGREFKKEGVGVPYVQKRFLSALCCKGRVSLSNPGADRLCVLDNELGMGHFYLQQLLPMALEKNYALILCPDCLDPRLISALIIPQLDLALFCGDALGDQPENCYRHIRLDAIGDREKLSSLRPQLRKTKRLGREHLSLAVDTLARAKALHDQLEEIYNPHVDFDGVYEEAERHIESLF